MKKFHFGENLRIIRLSKGYKQGLVSSELGISQATYSRIESQPVLEDISLLYRIAKFYDVKPTALVEKDAGYDLYFLDENPAVPKEKGLSKLPFANFLKLMAGAYAVNIAYEITGGFFRKSGMPVDQIAIAKWLVALVTALIISCLVFGFGKKYITAIRSVVSDRWKRLKVEALTW